MSVNKDGSLGKSDIWLRASNELEPETPKKLFSCLGKIKQLSVFIYKSPSPLEIVFEGSLEFQTLLKLVQRAVTLNVRADTIRHRLLSRMPLLKGLETLTFTDVEIKKGDIEVCANKRRLFAPSYTR